MERVLRAALLVSLTMCGSQGTDLNTLDSNDGGDGGSSLNPPPTPFTDPFAGDTGYAPPGQGGDTSHNPGRACSDKGCHGQGGEGPAFLIGGTIYKDYGGTIAAPNIEVRVIDGNGNAASTYSQSNGNFYIRAGTNGVTFPATVGARDATLSRPMITPLTGSMGSCAQSGCHVGEDAGGYYPIHIP